MQTLIPEAVGDGLRRIPGHPEAFFGRTASRRLIQVLEAFASRRCVVVKGSTSYDACGAAPYVELAVHGRRVAFLNSGPGRTKVETIADGLDAIRELVPDTVIGIGGGTTMDLAKAIAALSAYGKSGLLDAIHRSDIPRRARHLVLIPTTAGSGSELTQFATIWEKEEKHSLDSPEVRADVALIDPDLVASSPVPAAAAAGADALAQAAESCWAVTGTYASRKSAHAAFEVLVPALAAACKHGSFADPSLRDQLSWGAALAGAAINVSRTTAAHAFSYALTARLDIPHGAAVALHVPWLVEHNRNATRADCRLPAGPEALHGIIDSLERYCHDAAKIDIAALMRRLLNVGGFADDLSALRLNRAVWTAEWCRALESPRMRNNPRLVTAADVGKLLRPKAFRDDSALGSSTGPSWMSLSDPSL